MDDGISRPSSGSTAKSRPPSRPKTSSSSSCSADRRSSYAELKEKAASRSRCRLSPSKGVKITFNVDADYTIVRTRLTHNVVGIVEGSDPKLQDTYVAFGAHYDHIGYREGVVGAGRGGQPASRRSHQQRRRRRRVGDGGDHVDRARVRARAEAEALAALRLAHRRGEAASGLALQRRLSGRSDRQDRRAAEHGHGRPQSQRRSEAVEHGLRRRLRSHQHRAAQHQRGRQRVARRSR